MLQSEIRMACFRNTPSRAFASCAVITAARPEGRQMLIVPVKGLSNDRSWWKPLGMPSGFRKTRDARLQAAQARRGD